MVRSIILILTVARWCTPATVYYDLSEYCGTNRPIILPCGANDEGRVGTMEWLSQPQESCSVVVSIDNSTCSSTQTRKLYFNVKNLSLPPDDRLIIHENFTSYSTPHQSTVRLLRNISSSVTCVSRPSSCLHFMTRKLDEQQQTPNLEYITSVILAYSRGRQMAPSRYRITLDHTVVIGLINDTNIFCAATSGYVPKTEMCNDWDDRVVCPSNEPSSTGSFAFNTHQGINWYGECPPRTSSTAAPTSTKKTTTTTTMSAPYPGTLDDGAIVGIIVGSIIFIAFVVVMALICRRRSVTVVRSTYPPVATYCVPQVNPAYSTTTLVQTGGAFGSQQAYPIVPGGPPPYGPTYLSGVPGGYPTVNQTYGPPLPSNVQSGYHAPKF